MSENEREIILNAIKYARIYLGIEDSEPSLAEEKNAADYINGRITLDAFLRSFTGVSHSGQMPYFEG